MPAASERRLYNHHSFGGAAINYEMEYTSVSAAEAQQRNFTLLMSYFDAISLVCAEKKGDGH